MLELTIPAVELFDEATNRFINLPGAEIKLEHSLVSLSLWEAKYKLPFISKDDRTPEETLDYIWFMILGDRPNRAIIDHLPRVHVQRVVEYIGSSQTATVVKDLPSNNNSGEFITSELIYYWMVSLNIPWECQHWHLNRLITLVKIINAKSQTAKKMSTAEAAATQRDLNRQRRAKTGSSG